MPNIKSAKKRVEVIERNRAINKAFKSELATGLKKYNAVISNGDLEGAKELLPVTVSLIDESVSRGIIHKNKADRKKADVNSKYIALAKANTKVEKQAKAEVKVEAKTEVKAEEVVEAPKAKRTRAKKAETETAEEPKKTTRTRKTAAKKDAE